MCLPIGQRPDQVAIDRKVALSKRLNNAARSKDEQHIRQVSVGYADVIQQVAIANSDGVYVEDERVRTRMVVQVVASDGKAIQTGFDSAGGTMALNFSRRKRQLIWGEGLLSGHY